MQRQKRELKAKFDPQQKIFIVRDLESLAGKLINIANIAPWLRHLMAQFYITTTKCLLVNTKKLCTSRKSFREALKLAKQTATNKRSAKRIKFAQ